MSTNYIDLVVVKMHNDSLYLFQAPRWSHLEKDDVVRVDTVNGIQSGTVVGSITTNADLHDDEAKLLIDMLCATLPLAKVRAKLEYQDLYYADEEESENE
jgi:hypothetical protein